MDPISIPNFTLTEEGAQAVITIRAELDHGCALELRSLVDDVLSADRELRIDLSLLEFVDSTGMYALLQCTQRAAELGRTLTISGPLRPQPLRVLRLTGMDAKLAIDPIR